MKLFELLSGTKLVGKASERLGYKVVELRFKDSDIDSDISDWDYH